LDRACRIPQASMRAENERESRDRRPSARALAAQPTRSADCPRGARKVAPHAAAPSGLCLQELLSEFLSIIHSGHRANTSHASAPAEMANPARIVSAAESPADLQTAA